MFLMFQLKRPDVLAWGDLGVRKGAQLAYELEDLPHRTELEALAAPWSPYRTPRAASSGGRSTTSRPEAGDYSALTASSSSFTRKDEPQPQAATTFGFTTWNPAPVSEST